MKTNVIEVGGMLSALSARGVGKQLAKLPGVHKIEVNYIVGIATVVYDETVTEFKTIKSVCTRAVTTVPARCCRSIYARPRIRRTTSDEATIEPKNIKYHETSLHGVASQVTR